MKISQGKTEQGVVVGNTFDKYQSENPLVRRIMNGFGSALDELVGIANPQSIHEVGCGEGYWTLKWLSRGMAARGSDFSDSVVEMARVNAQEHSLSVEAFEQKSVYDLEQKIDSADLMVCCEVMEHLEHPEKALEVIRANTGRFAIFSVPREPMWRVLNMARGKYIRDLGNTPGHIQWWSKKRFIDFVSSQFLVDEIRTPIPWTMLLCRPKN